MWLRLMVEMQSVLWRLRHSEDGQAVSEYGVILAIILVGIIGGLIAMRGSLQTLFQGVTTSLNQ